MSHSFRSLVSRTIFEDRDVNVGWSEEGSGGEDRFEKLGDDGFGVVEIESEVEPLGVWRGRS